MKFPITAPYPHPHPNPPISSVVLFIFNRESFFFSMIEEILRWENACFTNMKTWAPSSEVLSKYQTWWPTLQAPVIPEFGRKRLEQPWGLRAGPSSQLVALRLKRSPFPGKVEGIPYDVAAVNLCPLQASAHTYACTSIAQMCKIKHYMNMPSF